MSRLRIAVPAAVGALTSAAWAQTFTPLGDLPGCGFASRAAGVNATGSVVVGDGRSLATGCTGVEAFRWTATGGLVALGDLPGGMFYSSATGAGADGSVVVGLSNLGDECSGEAFRWTHATGMVSLGDLPGGVFGSIASGVSADGSVVVGTADYRNSSYLPSGEAFRWSAATGMVGLGDLPGGAFLSRAAAVNTDGSVVVGNSWSELGIEAFRWTAAGGMVGLGGLGGGSFMSGARAVSANGSVVVGVSRSALGLEAFRWTAGQGMIGLGDLPNGDFDSIALDVSADGSVVVGRGNSGWGTSAFLWTSTTGMVNLKMYLAGRGVTGLESWMLNEALGVSDDGGTIVGVGTNPQGQKEAWVVSLSSPQHVARPRG